MKKPRLIDYPTLAKYADRNYLYQLGESLYEELRKNKAVIPFRLLLHAADKLLATDEYKKYLVPEVLVFEKMLRVDKAREFWETYVKDRTPFPLLLVCEKFDREAFSFELRQADAEILAATQNDPIEEWLLGEATYHDLNPPFPQWEFLVKLYKEGFYKQRRGPSLVTLLEEYTLEQLRQIILGASRGGADKVWMFSALNAPVGPGQYCLDFRRNPWRENSR